MSDNWGKKVYSVKQLRHKVTTENSNKYEFRDFRFERAGNNTMEFHLYYRNKKTGEFNRVETLSIDIIELDKLKKILSDIREEDPSSIREWLDSN